jgi:hypothetical protein
MVLNQLFDSDAHWLCSALNAMLPLKTNAHNRVNRMTTKNLSQDLSESQEI